MAPLEVWIEQPAQGELFEVEAEDIEQAVALAHEVFDAVERDAPLPDRFPKHLVPQYARWGQSLAEDEEVELVVPSGSAARVSPRFRQRFARFAETAYEAAADVTGEVLEADVRQRRFQLWQDDATPVSVSFTEAQEEVVTTALRDHRSMRLRVQGRVEHSPSGQVLRVVQVGALGIEHLAPMALDEAAPAIEDILSSIAAEVPDEEWDRLPVDLTDDLDHYLYGAPRR